MSIIEIHGVTKKFAQKLVLQNIYLSLEHGQILGLLGASGCGKTTLLRLIAGFEQPDTGSIFLDGRPVAKADPIAPFHLPPEQRQVGMVFQDYALFPHLNVEQNIAFGLQKIKNPALARQRLHEAIDLVGLTDFSKSYPHQLSGGQQQRVALARALAPRPAVILLDEPLSNLDVQVRLRLRREVRAILRAADISAVFVTHDQEEALCLCDQLAVMHQGRLEQVATPEQVYQNPASRFVAEFVCQANLIPAQRHQNFWVTEIGNFTALNPIAPDTAAVMLRPEDLQIYPDAQGVMIVSDRQFLGRESTYWLTTPSGQKLQARTRDVIAISTPVSCRIPEQPVQVFPF